MTIKEIDQWFWDNKDKGINRLQYEIESGYTSEYGDHDEGFYQRIGTKKIVSEKTYCNAMTKVIKAAMKNNQYVWWED